MSRDESPVRELKKPTDRTENYSCECCGRRNLRVETWDANFEIFACTCCTKEVCRQCFYVRNGNMKKAMCAECYRKYDQTFVVGDDRMDCCRKKANDHYVFVIGIAEEGCYTAFSLKLISKITPNDRALLKQAKTDHDVAYNLANATFEGWQAGPTIAGTEVSKIGLVEPHIVYMSN